MKFCFVFVFNVDTKDSALGDFVSCIYRLG